MKTIQKTCEDIVFDEIEEGQIFLRQVPYNKESLIQVLEDPKPKEEIKMSVIHPKSSYNGSNNLSLFIRDTSGHARYIPIQHPNIETLKIGDELMSLKDVMWSVSHRLLTKGKTYFVKKITSDEYGIQVIADDNELVWCRNTQFSIIRK